MCYFLFSFMHTEVPAYYIQYTYTYTRNSVLFVYYYKPYVLTARAIITTSTTITMNTSTPTTTASIITKLDVELSCNNHVTKYIYMQSEYY